MCTVSFVCSGNCVFITSNRDEHSDRAISQSPKTYLLNNRKVTFPQDPEGGGTWFAVNDHHSAIVLLNGAKEKHRRKPSYKKSRGLVVLELISAENSISSWETIDLSGIEPFTIVLYFKKRLYQLQWDELYKDKIELDARENYIWSSSTLYPDEIRNERKFWFKDFLEKNTLLDSGKILDFHTTAHSEDKINGLVINRNDKIKTVNITQLMLYHNLATFIHRDLVNKVDYTQTAYLI